MFPTRLTGLFLALNTAALANIVQNPGFEDPAGTFNLWTDSGWLFSGTAHSGTNAARNSSIATLTQTLSTEIGTSYTLSIWLHNTIAPNSFSGSLGGVEILSLTDVSVNNASVVYQQFFSSPFVATSTATVLSLTGSITGGNMRLDDVCVDVSGGACGGVASAVPEPCTSVLTLIGLTGLSVWQLGRLRKK